MVKLDDAVQFIPANTKILDINEDDTDNHICSLSAVIPPNCVAIVLSSYRTSGTGNLYVYANKGSIYDNVVAGHGNTLVYAINKKSQDIEYAQTVGGDDFDLYMKGYFVEGKVKQ